VSGGRVLLALEAAQARWPQLAGRAVHLAVAGPGPVRLEPTAEYVLWPLPGGEVVVVEREQLVPLLAHLAPSQLRQAAATVGEGRYEGAVLAEPARLLGYVSGEELAGLGYRGPDGVAGTLL
jgi:hypothetical protein